MSKLNIVVPIASPSDWASNSDYLYPKYLVDINGKPLIEYVLENLIAIERETYFYFIVKEEDCTKYHIDNILKLIVPNSKIVILKNTTKGAICSVLMVIDKINSLEECLIVNSDQIINVDFNKVLDYFRLNKVDGGIMTFPSVHPRWSFALIHNENVLQTAEKNPISKNAIAGFYYFKDFECFKTAAFKVISNNENTNGQFYTSAVLNYLVLLNKNVIHFPIKSKEYISFYSPQKIREFEQSFTKIKYYED